MPYLRANTGTAAAGGDQASSTARTTPPAIQPTARGKRRAVRIRGSGRWLGRICMVLSFVHQVLRRFSNRLRSTQDPCHQKGVGTREFRCTDASWRCEFVISTTRARRDGDIATLLPLSQRIRPSPEPAFRGRTNGRTGPRAWTVDAITSRRTETWREDPMLAKFLDEIAPIQAAHPPVIIRQSPP